jgi:pimeloyl-ACP methyl ester carboxylesterase
MNARMTSLAGVLLAAAMAGGAAAQPAGTAQANPWWGRYMAQSTYAALPDGRRLNLYCEGRGAPLVILDSGLGDGASSWRKVQGQIAKTTRVCAYDRAGVWRSSAVAAPVGRDTAALVADLEQLLRAAKLKGPYVLVGHSLAGYTTRLFASRHRDQVAGLVLVDPSSENQTARMAQVAPAFPEKQAAFYAT